MQSKLSAMIYNVGDPVRSHRLRLLHSEMDRKSKSGAAKAELERDTTTRGIKSYKVLVPSSPVLRGRLRASGIAFVHASSDGLRLNDSLNAFSHDQPSHSLEIAPGIISRTSRARTALHDGPMDRWTKPSMQVRKWEAT